jgi:flagellar protein FliO/FliZ
VVAAPAALQAFEDEPLKVSSTRRPATPQLPGSNTVVSQTGPDLSRVGLALAIVIGAIFLLRWVGRKMFVLPNGPKSNKAIKVLSRSVLSPKQQLLLLQVGKRLIVVGDSGGNMNALCEITDPDEVAAVVGAAVGGSQSDSTPLAKSFGGLFSRAAEPFSAAAAAEEEESNIEPAPELGLATHSDIGGLMEKIRLMKGQFKK